MTWGTTPAAAPPPAPPHNLEQEQGLLGLILVNNEALGYVVGAGLEPTDFFEPLHVAIYAEAARQIGAGKRVTPVSIKSALPLIEIAGMPIAQYLIRLATVATTTVNAGDYAINTRDLSLSRQLIEVTSQLTEAAAAPDLALSTLYAHYDDIRMRLSGYAAQRNSAAVGDTALRVAQHMTDIITGEVVPDTISTGIASLDKATDGIRPGELIIIAGRPGMGKSTVAASLGRQMVRPWVDPKTGEEIRNAVALFSLEMTESNMGVRLLADHARTNKFKIPYRKILLARDMNDGEQAHIWKAARAMSELPLHADYSPRLTIGEIAAKVRAIKRNYANQGIPLRALIIDYLKFIKPSQRYAGQRHYEVGEISAACKHLARDLNICVILLAQLNRDVEKTSDKRPELSNLRESGDLEADADAVWLLYREAYYLGQDPRSETDAEIMARLNVCRHQLELIIAKQRMGPTGSVLLYCDVDTSSLRNLATANDLLPEPFV